MTFFVKYFFSKCEKISRKIRICSQLPLLNPFHTTPAAFIYSKLTIETLEQGVKYIDAIGVVLMSLLLFEHISHVSHVVF